MMGIASRSYAQKMSLIGYFWTLVDVPMALISLPKLP
jgi:hypothetical protein